MMNLLSATVKGYMDQVAELTSTVEKEASNAKCLQAQVAVLTATIEDEKALTMTKETLVLERDAQLASQREIIAVLEAAAEDAEKQLRQAGTAARLAKEAAEAEMMVTQAELSQLQTKLRELSAEHEQAQAQISALTNQTDELTGNLVRLTALEKQHEVLLRSHEQQRAVEEGEEALKGALDAVQSKFIHSQTELDSLSRKFTYQQMELESLRDRTGQLALVEADRDRLQQMVYALEQTVATSEVTIAQIRAKSSAQTSVYATGLSTDSMNVLDDVRIKQQQLQQQQVMVLDLQVAHDYQIHSLSRTITALETDIAHLKTINASLTERIQSQLTEVTPSHSLPRTPTRRSLIPILILVYLYL